VVILVVVGILTALAMAVVFWRGLRKGGSSSTAVALAAVALETAIGLVLIPVGLAVIAVGGYRAGIGYVGIGVVVVPAAVWLVFRLRLLNLRMGELTDRKKAEAARHAAQSRRPPSDPPAR
jgi:hypothetical protein